MKNFEGSHTEDVEESGAHHRDRFKRNTEGTGSLSKVVPPSPECSLGFCSCLGGWSSLRLIFHLSLIAI